MSFGSIVANTTTFEERSLGEYHEQGKTFSEPANYFRLRPGAVRKDGLRSCGVTRVQEKDIVENGDTVRQNIIATLNIVMPNSGTFTAAEADALASDISDVMTPEFVSALLQGKS